MRRSVQLNLLALVIGGLCWGGCTGLFGGFAAGDVDYTALAEELEEYTAELPDVTFGIYVQDLASGSTVEVGGNTPLPAASSIKAPIALHLYKEIARGTRSFDDRLEFRETHMTGGAGVLQAWAEAGQAYSLRFLLNVMITISDNVAWWMLDDHGGREQIASFMAAAGGETVYPDGQNLSTAKDMGVYLERVIEFAQTEPALGGLLLDDLQYSLFEDGIRGGVPLGVSVAHKVGSLSDVANDIAIVGGERPYILAILSEGHEDAEVGFDHIEALAERVHAFQQELPPAPHVDPFGSR